eukprot:gene1420-1792_t
MIKKLKYFIIVLLLLELLLINDNKNLVYGETLDIDAIESFRPNHHNNQNNNNDKEYRKKNKEAGSSSSDHIILRIQFPQKIEIDNNSYEKEYQKTHPEEYNEHKDELYSSNDMLKPVSNCVVHEYCKKCLDSERKESFCQKTGYRKVLNCKVNGGSPDGQPRYIYHSCYSSTSKTTNILYFEACILGVLLVSLYFVRERKRFMVAQQNERLAKQLNKL